MNRMEIAFRRLRQHKEKALIAYLTVGFPKLSALGSLAAACQRSGVDLLELGIPFSDPLADGPTIQAASQRALKQGVTPSRVLSELKHLRRGGLNLPVALMTYFNPVFHYGVDRFCRDAAEAGADGLIIPDLPPEEAKELLQAGRRWGLRVVFLASPISPADRLKRIARASSGFIYFVSLTGVTGARETLSDLWLPRLKTLRRFTSLPICLGFGISTPSQVQQICRWADGVIVGSSLLNIIGRAGKSPGPAAERFLRPLKEACR